MFSKIIFKTIFAAIFLFIGVNSQAQSCTSHVECSNHTTASCSVVPYPKVDCGFLVNGECYERGVCGDVDQNARHCTTEVVDKQSSKVVAEGSTYVCCQNNTAISTTNLADCR